MSARWAVQRRLSYPACAAAISLLPGVDRSIVGDDEEVGAA